MLKRIAPRCDRKYTFHDNNGEFTLRPKFVDNFRCIVFKNVTTGNDVSYTYNEFADMYENKLIREKYIKPSFFSVPYRKNEKVYAVARGRIDCFITNKKDEYDNAIAEFQDVQHDEFDNFFDALDFISNADKKLPESVRFIETSLTDAETSLIMRYRNLSKVGKRHVREFMDEEY